MGGALPGNRAQPEVHSSDLTCVLDLLEKQGQKLFDLTREVLGIVKGITQGQVNSSSLLRRVTWSWKQQLALLHDLFADPGEDEETLPPEMMDSHHAEVATRADEISTNSHQQPALNGRVRGNAEHRHTPPAGASLQRKSAVSEKALFISSDTLCQGCGQCIDSQEHVVVQSHVYHRGCFMCCECGRVSVIAYVCGTLKPYHCIRPLEMRMWFMCICPTLVMETCL